MSSANCKNSKNGGGDSRVLWSEQSPGRPNQPMSPRRSAEVHDSQVDIVSCDLRDYICKTRLWGIIRTLAGSAMPPPRGIQNLEDKYIPRWAECEHDQTKKNPQTHYFKASTSVS